MRCNSRICEPCKVSEVLAGACLVGRPASAFGTLLGFNTHLDLSDLLFLLVILMQPESPYLHFQGAPARVSIRISPYGSRSPPGTGVAAKHFAILHAI